MDKEKNNKLNVEQKTENIEEKTSEQTNIQENKNEKVSKQEQEEKHLRENEKIERVKEEYEKELAELREKVKALENENSTLKDQYLRKQAEFDNFRKRMRKDKEDMVKFSNQKLLENLLPIIDDFERAILSTEESKDFDSFHSGIVLIEKQFTTMLENKWGLKRFESKGEEFDPQKHQAVATGEDTERDNAIVLEDYQKGYYLHDRVLRPAKVKVAMPGGSKQSKDDNNSSSKDEENT